VKIKSPALATPGASGSDHERFFAPFASDHIVPVTPTATAPIGSSRPHSGSFSECQMGTPLGDAIDFRPRAGSHDSISFRLGSKLQMSVANPLTGFSNATIKPSPEIWSPGREFMPPTGFGNP
jgi:hypothetical protein